MNIYESLADALADLRKRGYDSDFETETMGLYCGDLDMRLDPEDFHVTEIYRFEGNSNPGDNAVLYAISSSFGIKGTLVDRQGSNNTNLNAEMAKKLQHHPSLERRYDP